MVKQKYREIVSVETGGVPGREAGYYYYDSRPNTPKTLLFQKTTAQAAYDTSTQKGIPTAGAFFGKGTGARAGGEGRYQILKYGRDKVTPEQIAKGREEAYLRKMSAVDQDAYKLDQIMKQLSIQQRAGVKTGTSKLIHRPGGYAPRTDLFGEYGVETYGRGAFTPESWLLSDTQKGLAQREREGRLMWELGEGRGIPPLVGVGDQISLEEIRRELEFNPRSKFAETYGKYIQRDPTGLTEEFGTGYTVPRFLKSAMLQYEADQIPRYAPIEPYSLSQNLRNIFGAFGLPSSLDDLTFDPRIDPLGLSPANLMVRDWDQLQAGLGTMGDEITRRLLAAPPPWQLLADQLYPRSGTNLADWDASGLGSSYISPGESASSIFGPMGFRQALAEKKGIETPHDRYDPTVGLWTPTYAEGFGHDPLTGYSNIQFSPSSTDPWTQLMGHLTDAKLRQERFMFEGPKAGLNLLNIPAGLEFLIGAGQVPGEIWRGGRTPDEFAAYMKTRSDIMDANRRAQSFTVDPAGVGLVTWPDSTTQVPEIGRFDEAGRVKAETVAALGGMWGGLKQAHAKDPDLFYAQLAGELAAYPLIAGKLAKGGALSRKLGRGFEFITEPGEALFEAGMNLRFPGLAQRLGGSLGPEELALFAAMTGGRGALRMGRAGVRTFDEFMQRTFTPRVNWTPGEFVTTYKGGDVPGYQIPESFRIQTGVDIPGYPMPHQYTAGRYLTGDQGPLAIETMVELGDLEFPPRQSDYVTFQNPNLIGTNGGQLITFDRMSTQPWQMQPSKVSIHDIIDPRMMQSQTPLTKWGYDVDPFTYLDTGPMLTTSRTTRKPFPGQMEDPRTGKTWAVDEIPPGQLEMSAHAETLRREFELRQAKQRAGEQWDEGRPHKGTYYDKKTHTLNFLDEFGNWNEIQAPSTPQDYVWGGAMVPPLQLKQWADIYGPELRYQYDEIPTIDSRVLRGRPVDLDWMPPEAVFTPRQLLEQQLIQRQQLQDPMSYGTDPTLRFDFPGQVPEMMTFDQSFDFPPGQRELPPILTPIEETILAESTVIRLKDKSALEAALDYKQAQRQALKVPSRARARLRADFPKRQKEAIKKLQAARKRLDRTRRKFLFDLFKNEIDIPRVNVPSVNVPSVNIPTVAIPNVLIPGVRIPSVNVPSVNVEAVNVPVTNIPSVNIPSVNVPKVDYQLNVPSVNVPKVNIPAVRIYD